MRIYLATPSFSSRERDALLKCEAAGVRPQRMLFSFHGNANLAIDEIHEALPGVEIFLDSGAYSAFASGAQIDPEKYLRWVDRWASKVVAAAAPDVIGDATRSHALTLEALQQDFGVPMLPVFHVGDPWSYLEEYAGLTEYLAFGGMVPFVLRGEILRRWIAEGFRRLSHSHRVHAFGLTVAPLLHAFPWCSADSSTWMVGCMFGTCLIFDGFDFHRVVLTPKNAVRYARALRGFDADLSLLASAGKSPEKAIELLYVGARSMRALEDWLGRKERNGNHA